MGNREGFPPGCATFSSIAKFAVFASAKGRFNGARHCCVGFAAVTFRQLVHETGEMLAKWDAASLPLPLSSFKFSGLVAPEGC